MTKTANNFSAHMVIYSYYISYLNAHYMNFQDYMICIIMNTEDDFSHNNDYTKELYYFSFHRYSITFHIFMSTMNNFQDYMIYIYMIMSTEDYFSHNDNYKKELYYFSFHKYSYYIS